MFPLINYCADNMWNWAFHVKHNWQANLPRKDIKKVETLWQKQLERKRKVPKSYDKRCHNKSRKQLNKEGTISFLRLGFKRRKVRKYVVGKSRKELNKEGGDSAQKKERQKKLSLTKVETMGLRRAYFPSLMNDMDRETSHKVPYFPISQGGCICG